MPAQSPSPFYNRIINRWSRSISDRAIGNARRKHVLTSLAVSLDIHVRTRSRADMNQRMPMLCGLTSSCKDNWNHKRMYQA